MPVGLQALGTVKSELKIEPVVLGSRGKCLKVIDPRVPKPIPLGPFGMIVLCYGGCCVCGRVFSSLTSPPPTGSHTAPPPPQF